jgi:hypothetical protein
VDATSIGNSGAGQTNPLDVVFGASVGVSATAVPPLHAASARQTMTASHILNGVFLFMSFSIRKIRTGKTMEPSGTIDNHTAINCCSLEINQTPVEQEMLHRCKLEKLVVCCISEAKLPRII